MWPIVALLIGLVLCVAGGLLGLAADSERPLRFVPVYVVAAVLFLGGMALMFWFQPAGEYLRAALTRAEP